MERAEKGYSTLREILVKCVSAGQVDTLVQTLSRVNVRKKKKNKHHSGSTAGMILYPAVSVTVVVVLLAVFLLLLYKWKKRRSSNDVNSRSHVTDTNMEPVYENSAPVSTLGEFDYENVNPSSNYETLNPATMSHDQTYSTLRQQI
ncbi:uncharacterized protein LOC128357692 [Scomber scombrus]|uniref:Uncharacterized protein LOC128357692 n=1 Tax=Scomber scombrus TaxID=13677 RepID=A0AAV1QAP7_SCOSC